MKVLLAMLLTTTSALPVELSLLGGSEVDTEEQSYSYLGLLGEERLNGSDSIMGKAWIDYLTYRFEQGNTEVKAKAPALQLSLGYRRYFSGWNVTGWLGWERRNTNVNPDVSGVEVKGLKDSLLLQFEVNSQLNSSTNASFIASYSSATSYLWARGRFKRSVFSEKTRLGVELIGHGNEDYRAVQAGLLGEYSVGKFTGGVRGGYKNSSKGNSLYVGFEVYLGF